MRRVSGMRASSAKASDAVGILASLRFHIRWVVPCAGTMAPQLKQAVFGQFSEQGKCLLVSNMQQGDNVAIRHASLLVGQLQHKLRITNSLCAPISGDTIERQGERHSVRFGKTMP